MGDPLAGADVNAALEPLSMEHHAHHDGHRRPDPEGGSHLALAVSATVHCLIGCGLGEVLGMIIGQLLGLHMWPTTILAILLGAVLGLALGVVPLLRRKFGFREALKLVIVAEGLSIAVMEAFEVLTQYLIPGVMEAGLTTGIFWLGMLASLVVGFLAALPVNYVMIRRGVRHMH